MEVNQELIMNKSLFIGASAGVFFILVDEDIYDNFNKLADMMDVFIEKTSQTEAPFLVYGLIENKQKIAALRTNKELLKNLADVKKWVSQHRGEFRLENLKEMKSNLSYLINDYSHFILNKLKGKTHYPNLQLGEVHYLDYDDLNVWKEIENSLVEQISDDQSIDQLLEELFFKFLKTSEFQEEVIEYPREFPSEEPFLKKQVPSKMKTVITEIRNTIRRTCPNCGNNNRKLIRELIDRENIIMENPNIYGLKYICGNCGYEWK